MYVYVYKYADMYMYIYIYTVRISQPHFRKEILIRELPKNEKPEFDSSKQRGKVSYRSKLQK